MEIKEYQKQAYTAIQDHEDLKDEILNWAIGLSEEVGEVMSILKHRCWGKEYTSREELAKEVGDVLWYLSALCTALHLDLDTVAQLNVAKLQHRFGSTFDATASKQRHAKEQCFAETEQYKMLTEKLWREKTEGK